MTTPDVPLRLEFEIEVPGTPEQVWDALATAGRHQRLVPADRVRGAPRRRGSSPTWARRTSPADDHRLGPTPPVRLRGGHRGRSPARTDAAVTPLASEFLVEARSGGTCVVRVVSVGVRRRAPTGSRSSSTTWSTAGCRSSSSSRLYLSHFPGQRATHVHRRHAGPGRRRDGPGGRVRAAASVADAAGAASSSTARRGIVEQLEPGAAAPPRRTRCRACCASRPAGPARSTEVSRLPLPARRRGRRRASSTPSGRRGRRSSTRLTAEVPS